MKANWHTNWLILGALCLLGLLAVTIWYVVTLVQGREFPTSLASPVALLLMLVARLALGTARRK